MPETKAETKAELVLPTTDLRADLPFFTKTLGMRMDMIYPADNPAVAGTPEEPLTAALSDATSMLPKEEFDALIDGCSNKEIAQRLEISPRTVEIFRAKVMTKMQAANLSTLVRIGMRAGDA